MKKGCRDDILFFWLGRNIKRQHLLHIYSFSMENSFWVISFLLNGKNL